MESDERLSYTFGPVPSRRLGQSLGIDTIPLKTCNWNCVYCQLGRTVPLNNERREYFPREDILAQTRAAIARHKPGEIDWVTYVGSGEPTLHSSLGWLIEQVKELTNLPVAVITNGSLLYLHEVRRDLALADAVLPTLDAGSAKLYRRINRPHPEVTYARLLDGLIAFRQEYEGKLWIEVMLVRGMNDGEKALREIAAALGRIRPDEIHINMPTRPPAETWVRPPDEQGLERALTILGDIAKVVHQTDGEFDLGGCDNVIEAILGIITRHPMSQGELEQTLVEWVVDDIDDVFRELEKCGRAQSVERLGTRFWSAIPAHYPNKESSLSAAPSDRHQRRNANNKDT